MIFNVHAGHNPDGKVGCGAIGLIKESTENRNVKNEVIKYLRALGHTAYDCTVDNGTSSSDVLQKIVAKCNAHTVDYDISIHFNAGVNNKDGNGKTTGTEVYVYNTDKNDPKNKAQAICNAIAELGFKNRGVKERTNLYVLKHTNAKAMLIEVCFVDDKDDVTLYQKVGASGIAKAIVKGLTGETVKESNTTSTTTTSKTYKVVKEINKYANATDAINQTNSKGKLAVGTYYLYNKYPNGYKGVYNVTTNASSAGSWINPKENVIQESTSTTTVQKLYRVRKSKDDTKSQIGAYSSLDNAKTACQNAGAGYHVFDWNYKIVYSYTASAVTPTPTPVQPSEPEKVVAVYDLDYPEKTKIVNKDILVTEGINEEECTKAIKKILANNKDFDINIAKAFFELAPLYDIDPMMAISQSILETGWFKYNGSAVKAEQHNYCGLGVVSNGVTGATFDTIEDGVRAQLQHLYAYGCKDELPLSEKTLLDPRFHLVTRGIATYWQQLAGRWAVPGYDKNTYSTPQKAMEAGNTYGQKIRTIYNQLVATTITDEDIKEIFDKGDIEEPTNDNIVVLIIDCIKKLIEFLTTYLTKKDV